MSFPFIDFTKRFKNGIPQFKEFGDTFLTKPGETLIDASNRLEIFDLGELKKQNKTFNTQDVSQPQPIVVKGDPELIVPELKAVITYMESICYKVFKDGSKNYNLNLVGLRSESEQANRFDDQLWVFWKFENRWQLKKYKVTTDPGLYWLNKPGRQDGTAILKEGQYDHSHKLGKHKGVYEALVQAQPVTVIRDFNRDNKLDYSSGKETTGLFGINIHRASDSHESTQVDKWSAGCQVFARPTEFSEFIKLCKLSVAEWGNSFTYTLIRKRNVSGLG